MQPRAAPTAAGEPRWRRAASERTSAAKHSASAPPMALGALPPPPAHNIAAAAALRGRAAAAVGSVRTGLQLRSRRWCWRAAAAQTRSMRRVAACGGTAPRSAARRAQARRAGSWAAAHGRAVQQQQQQPAAHERSAALRTAGSRALAPRAAAQGRARARGGARRACWEEVALPRSARAALSARLALPLCRAPRGARSAAALDVRAWRVPRSGRQGTRCPR